jgi:hypothetical protein
MRLFESTRIRRCNSPGTAGFWCVEGGPRIRQCPMTQPSPVPIYRHRRFQSELLSHACTGTSRIGSAIEICRDDGRARHRPYPLDHFEVGAALRYPSSSGVGTALPGVAIHLVGWTRLPCQSGAVLGSHGGSARKSSLSHGRPISFECSQH